MAASLATRFWLRNAESGTFLWTAGSEESNPSRGRLEVPYQHGEISAGSERSKNALEQRRARTSQPARSVNLLSKCFDKVYAETRDDRFRQRGTS